jgi:peptide/nickel transport system substrate-binding protein
MEAGDRTNSIDPAIAYSDRTWSLLAIVADGLVGHRRLGGAAGADIVADLARTVPAPTDGGLTYRFQLRPGLRYSTGEPVRAGDVRASIERLHGMRTFALGSLALTLRGEQNCGSRRCDLSRGIESDDTTGTVTFHLRRANPDFLINLAAPIYSVLPSATPPHDVTGPGLVGTGPYHVAAYTPGREVMLARNPRFMPWSNAAQPPGFPDRIVWRLVKAPDGAHADVALGPGIDAVARLRATAPQRIHTTPIPFAEYVWLNTRVRPFIRADARRALAYAIDRSALRRRLPAVARASLRPTCQILSPGFSGYEPFCPFADHPSAGDVPDAPNLARARRLVRRSGTAGAAVTFYAPADNPAARAIGRAIVRTLRRIGYRPRLNASLPSRDGDYFLHTVDPRTRAQAGWALWFGETPAASNVIPPLLSCRARERRADTVAANQAQHCDRALEPAMRRAHALQADDPAAANQIWARLDHTLTRRAPIIPLFSMTEVHLISTRLGNYQSHIRLGPLLAQAWVR